MDGTFGKNHTFLDQTPGLRILTEQQLEKLVIGPLVHVFPALMSNAQQPTGVVPEKRGPVLRIADGLHPVDRL